MKSFLLPFILLFTLEIIHAQTPDWQAYLLVDQPWNGNTDTIWFGLDYDATNGYDDGLDIMDTTFNYPLAIRLQNGQVQADSNTCAANMRRDIKAFAPEVTWDVFVKADTFTETYEEYVILRWDTAQFNFSDGQYFLKYAKVETTTGYIGGIDGTNHCLATNVGDCGSAGGGWPDHAGLIYIGIQPLEYNTGTCATEEYIYRFRIYASFEDLLNINASNNTSVEFINQFAERLLQINNLNGGIMEIEVFQVNGNQVFKTQTFETNYNLHYKDLMTGVLIVRIITNDQIPHTFSLINY